MGNRHIPLEQLTEVNETIAVDRVTEEEDRRGMLQAFLPEKRDGIGFRVGTGWRMNKGFQSVRQRFRRHGQVLFRESASRICRVLASSTVCELPERRKVRRKGRTRFWIQREPKGVEG